MSAAIWPWLARKELASAAVTLTTTVIGRCSRAGTTLGRHDSSPRRAMIGTSSEGPEPGSRAHRVLEDARGGVAHRRGPLTRDATLVEQAEQAAADERALQRTGERCCDGLADRHAREVGEDTVGETAELQLAGTDEADQGVLRTREGGRERPLRGGGRIPTRELLEEPLAHRVELHDRADVLGVGGAGPPSSSTPVQLMMCRTASSRISCAW